MWLLLFLNLSSTSCQGVAIGIGSSNQVASIAAETRKCSDQVDTAESVLASAELLETIKLMSSEFALQFVGRYGGGETQGRRGVVAGGRLEWNHDQSDVPGEKTKVGENHVTEPAYFGSSSLPGIDATLEAPKQLTVTTHGSSKGEGAGVKSDFKTSIKIDSSPATYCTRSEVAEEMQWEKVQNQALRKAPSEVIPIPTSIISISPSVPDLSRSEDDIPPGFEGHHRNVVVGSKVLDKTEGYKGNCESLVQKYPEILSSPPKKSNGPTIGTTWANPSVGYSALDKQQDQPLILNSCVSHGPQLSDISNQHHTKHVSHVLGPKWSRVLRSPSDFKLSNGFGLDQYNLFIFIDFRIIHTTGIVTTGIEFRDLSRVGIIWIRHSPPVLRSGYANSGF
ncbi:hypothetical protein CFP56_024821 [Quercus suber]|uniref:Uncharacterized protein n=1 Tax=Quercus suber TaxID=58331 RepID=A0AAW0K6U5_QUESU